MSSKYNIVVTEKEIENAAKKDGVVLSKLNKKDEDSLRSFYKNVIYRQKYNKLPKMKNYRKSYNKERNDKIAALRRIAKTK